ncbi:hypothetical protein CP02DC18_1276, partial [Chlamydia psittaci 02DC18]
NQTRPVETGFDWLNTVLTVSNHSRRAETGFHGLKPVLT